MKRLLSLFSGRVPLASAKELAHADVVICHQFGDGVNVSMSTSSIMLKACGLVRRYKLPLMCQHPGEIVALDKDVTPCVVVRDETHLLSTYEVNERFAQECAARRWRTVIVCAHPDAAWRIGENLKHFGIVPRFPDLSNVSYDEFCARPVIRWSVLYLLREYVKRCEYWMKGYFRQEVLSSKPVS